LYIKMVELVGIAPTSSRADDIIYYHSLA